MFARCTIKKQIIPGKRTFRASKKQVPDTQGVYRSFRVNVSRLCDIGQKQDIQYYHALGENIQQNAVFQKLLNGSKTTADDEPTMDDYRFFKEEVTKFCRIGQKQQAIDYELFSKKIKKNAVFRQLAKEFKASNKNSGPVTPVPPPVPVKPPVEPPVEPSTKTIVTIGVSSSIIGVIVGFYFGYYSGILY